MRIARPEVGQWYTRTDKGETFQVVAFDDEERAIEIQAIGGDIDEIDSETWRRLPLQISEPPEDVAAPMDAAEEDDIESSENEPPRSEAEAWEDSEADEEEGTG